MSRRVQRPQPKLSEGLVGAGRLLRSPALLLAALLLPACATRSLTIQTNPAGADVFVDGDYAGVSPVTIPFVYGGHREILVYPPRTGTDTRFWRPERLIYDTTKEEFDAPMIDLVADITGSEDKQTVTIQLKESNDRRIFQIDEESLCAPVRARANMLRVRARESQLGALPSDQGRDPGPLESLRPSSRPAASQPSNPALERRLDGTRSPAPRSVNPEKR